MKYHQYTTPSFLRALSRNLSDIRRSPLRLVPTLDWVACGDDVFLLGVGVCFVGGEL